MIIPGNVAHFVGYFTGLRGAATQTTVAERELLAELAARSRVLVEVGVFEGVSSLVLRGGMPADASLFLIDPLPVGRLRFSPQWCIARREVNRSAKGSVTFLRKTAAEAIADWSRPVDLLFYDAHNDYEGVRRDFELWAPKLANTGHYLLHTSRMSPAKPVEPHTGTIRFANEIESLYPEFKVCRFVDSITVVGRRDSASP
jgi:hypothetical protein